MSDGDGQRRAGSSVRVAGATAVALCCFAANSLLCRTALRPGLIDAMSFLSLRLAAGAAVLAILVRSGGRQSRASPGGMLGALWLVGYGVAFSLAYLRLTAGAGALVLFGVTQLSMLAAGLGRGERPGAVEWLGLLLGLGGLVALTLPGLSSPDPVGVGLMAVAGVSWAGYSLYGRSAASPLASNASSFARALPLALAANLVAARGAHASWAGAGLAVASGALASGLGYVVWYTALRGLTRTRAALVQLAVPALAAAGGAAFLDETLSARLVGAGAVTLSGVLLAQLSHAGVFSARVRSASE